MNKQPLLNTFVNNIGMSEAINAIENMLETNGKYYVIPINVDVVIKAEADQYLNKIINDANLVLVDGQPLIWISKLHKLPVKEKISGSDLVPFLCGTAALKGYSIFILGGKEGIADQAARKLEEKYNSIKIAGTYSPPFGFENDKNELKKINKLISSAHPDILIACFGCPKQEKWVYENYLKYDAKVSICAGATVDFLAGNIKRSPKWISDHGLEWLFRFVQEPKRLFKRYFLDDIQIIKLVFKYR